MKILFVSSGNNQFGPVPFIKSQADSLLAKGINVDFFLIKKPGFWGYLKSIHELKRYFSKNYDIIHAHYSLCGLVAFLSMPKVPIIVSYMGCDVYGDVDILGRRLIKSFLVISISHFLALLVNCIIFKSDSLSKYIKFARKRVIIPNGVNFDKFYEIDKNKARFELKLNQKKRYILFLGNRNDPRKNYSLLTNALSILNDNNIEILAPFPVPHNIIPLYINSADVVALTSFCEGSPNIIKEAMACNAPIVSTQVGDVMDIISGTYGCYITSFDTNDFARKLKKALSIKNRTDGRKNIQYLNTDIIADNLIQLYKSVLI